VLGAEKRLSAEHPLLVAAEQEARVARDSARDNLREIKAKGEVFFLPTITSDSFFFLLVLVPPASLVGTQVLSEKCLLER
jgi:hypothetical protein